MGSEMCIRDRSRIVSSWQSLAIWSDACSTENRLEAVIHPIGVRDRRSKILNPHPVVLPPFVQDSHFFAEWAHIRFTPVIEQASGIEEVRSTRLVLLVTQSIHRYLINEHQRFHYTALIVPQIVGDSSNL